MNTSEKASVNRLLTNLISRLEELLSRQIELEEGWKEISTNIRTVHTIFNNIVTAFKQECELRLEDLDSPLWPYRLINELIEHLYSYTFQLRELHALLFMYPSPNRLYFYLLFQELMHCLRNITVAPSDLSCVMIGTGSMAYWHLDEVLMGKIRSFRLLLEPEVRSQLDDAITSTTAGFECDFQEPLDRQMILGHEIFHAVVRRNPDLQDDLQRIAGNATLQNIFAAAGQPLNAGIIQELFCDFSAAWFFGPIYAKAFVEEIVFRQKGGSPKHPHRILRLLMISCMWPKKTKFHPYISELSKYIKAHKNNIGISQRNMELIAKEFRLWLKNAGFKRYVTSENSEEIKEYIENNMSYIYSEDDGDVRKLLNSLPNKSALSEKARKNYSEFLLESIRKNAMWRQFHDTKNRLALRLPPNN